MKLRADRDVDHAVAFRYDANGDPLWAAPVDLGAVRRVTPGLERMRLDGEHPPVRAELIGPVTSKFAPTVKSAARRDAGSVIITVPAGAVAEWWRGGNAAHRSAAILAVFNIEPLSERLAKLTGEALAVCRTLPRAPHASGSAYP
jgi:hypothetical protein